jgi:hypothetical protein
MQGGAPQSDVAGSLARWGEEPCRRAEGMCSFSDATQKARSALVAMARQGELPPSSGTPHEHPLVLIRRDQDCSWPTWERARGARRGVHDDPFGVDRSVRESLGNLPGDIRSQEPLYGGRRADIHGPKSDRLTWSTSTAHPGRWPLSRSSPPIFSRSCAFDPGTAQALTGIHPGYTPPSPHSGQTLETVKHHLKPIRQPSVGLRQRFGGSAVRGSTDVLQGTSPLGRHDL